jgi:hypothetical protein
MMTVRLQQVADAFFGLAEMARGRLDVHADGALCASVVPRGESFDVPVGAAGQPAACSREGAVVEIVNGAGQTLFVTGTVRAGSTLVVQNFAPLPPHAAHAGVPAATVPEASGGALLVAGACLVVAVAAWWVRWKGHPRSG